MNRKKIEIKRHNNDIRTNYINANVSVQEFYSIVSKIEKEHVLEQEPHKSGSLHYLYKCNLISLSPKPHTLHANKLG